MNLTDAPWQMNIYCAAVKQLLQLVDTLLINSLITD